MSKPLIVLTDPIHEAALARLGGLDVTILPDLRPETYRPLLRQAHVFVVRSGAALPDDILDDTPNLIGVVRHGAGIDVIPMAAANRLMLPVANVPGGNALAVAEQGLILMGMLSRRTHLIDRRMRSDGWFAAHPLGGGAELTGKTVGIVGVGAVGGRLATICHRGLDMRILGHQRDLFKLPDHVQGVDLDTLFAESDFVVLCCPITPQTHHLCSRRRLDRMKPSAFLLNLGRGALVDTAALLHALDRGRLAGAGLDVFEQEPLPPGHPLLADDRVILTPHIAARSNESIAYVGDTAVTQVFQLLNDEAPQYLVNPDSWAASSARRRAIISALDR